MECLVDQTTVSSLLLRNFDDCIRILDLAFKLYKCELTQRSPAAASGEPVSPGTTPLNVRDYEMCIRQKGWCVSRICDFARLARHDDKGLCVLAFCGSVTQEDWETNLHCRQTVANRFAGGVHTGYLFAYESLRSDLLASISNLPHRRWNCFSIGFGSGGAYATLALHDIIECFGSLWHGARFNNISTPRFFGYFISSPPIVTQSVVAHFDQLVGQNNMLSQFAGADLFCNGWSTLVQEIVSKLERLDSNEVSKKLLAQVKSIDWLDELDTYRRVGQYAVQTAHGASLQYDSVQELQVPSSAGLNMWVLFRYVLASLGLTAHLGGSMHGEFVRWLVERPTSLHLEKGRARTPKVECAQLPTRSVSARVPQARMAYGRMTSDGRGCSIRTTSHSVNMHRAHLFDIPKIPIAVLPSFAQNRAWNPTLLRASIRPLS